MNQENGEDVIHYCDIVMTLKKNVMSLIRQLKLSKGSSNYAKVQNKQIPGLNGNK